LSDLIAHFARFRAGIIGADTVLPTGKPLVYADWTASGRLYGPVEAFLRDEIGPLVANTHSESTYTGTAMTRAYHDARAVVRQHVGAGPQDSLHFTGFGMTAAINKLQRLLGLRGAPGVASADSTGLKKLVLVTHMEHHSNQITWEECDVDVEILARDEATGLPDLADLERRLQANAHRPLLMGAFTAGSNVTGLLTPWHQMAALMHRYGGLCFVDFAAAAPYVDITMHPADPAQQLDAITFSPHKFLGGPGSSGVLVLNNALYRAKVPDQPGGGTVKWTTPFGTHAYVDDIETREDGGTPGFLQAIKAALAIRVKEAMGTAAMRERENQLMTILLAELKQEPALMLLEGNHLERLGIVSFYAPGEHHNLIVRLLDERFGIQTRGGCSCAGTYGHILFGIGQGTSHRITDMIDAGDLSEKPGWVRVSLHPTMTDDEVRYIGQGIVAVVRNLAAWGKDHRFDKNTGEYLPPGNPAAVDLLSRFRVVTPLASRHDRGHRIAVDVGGTKILAVREGTEGPSGPFAASHRVATEAQRGGESIFETLCSAVEAVLPREGWGTVPSALAVCVPGIVDPATGTVMDCSNLPGWNRFDLARRLRGRFGVPVVVENDARAACWAEATTGAGSGVANLVFVTLSTGIGAGFVIDGRLYCGTRGVAGELGETKDDAGSPIEWRGAGPALERLFGVPAETLRRRFDEGDPQALLAFEHLVTVCGRLLANVGTLIDPELIVIGGGLAQLGPWLLDALQERVRTEAYSLARSVRLVPARWSTEAGVRGLLSLLDGSEKTTS